uniref:Thioredoxin domain-containing protein n=1 Tax=Photinus pyralis TaxID=7054 RepID=A0A1Y1KFP0_PHOPY
MTDILASHEEFVTFITERGDSDKDSSVKEYLKKLKYPPISDFGNGLEWFNTSEPLSFKTHLRGKVVLLDFFTYCCINCMHLLPELKELEKEFTIEDGLVVVGVHSAKFANEKISANIMAAVQRYGITHPVVNDHKSSMWKSCNVNCWPTLLLIGPQGVPIIMLMGEGNNEDLRLCIRNALEFYKSKKLISNHKIPLKSVFHYLPESKGPLLFPGKVTYFLDRPTNYELIAISDTGNHRILVINSGGNVIHEIGGNGNGLKDGSFTDARFNSPQGLVFQSSSTIFVADTENHAIRKINLDLKTVTTVVGTGEQGNDYKGGNEGPAQLISSPWDVCICKMKSSTSTEFQEILFIAMAGLHQIWALFLDCMGWWKNRYHIENTCSAIAGCGREENKNNHYPFAAAFAQPSGLSLCEKDNVMYVADSESSSVRKIFLADGKVSAVVGGDLNPLNLFSYGDKDGKRHEAKLQHALGVAASKVESVVFVADSYNHKIKRINATDNTISTLHLSNFSTFNEPGGLCLSTDETKLYVADTNNHAIKVLHVDKDYSVTNVTTLDITFPPAHISSPPEESVKDIFMSKNLFVNPKGGKLNLLLKIDLINGLNLTKGAPQGWNVELPNSTWFCAPSSGTDVLNVDALLTIPPTDFGTTYVDFVFNIMACKDTMCIPKKFVIRQPIEFSPVNTMARKIALYVLDQSSIQQQY